MKNVDAPRPGHNDTRERIVRIGTEILSEKGFGSTGLEEVLEKARVPKGSFYYYFKNKAEFGYAVIENYNYIWAQKLTRILRDPAVAPLARIDNYFAEAIRGLEKYAFRRGCLIGNLGQEMGSLDEEFRDRLLKVFDSWTVYVVDCLAEAKSRGDIAENTDIGRIAKFFWFAWEGAVLQAKLEKSVVPIENFRDVMMNSILGRKNETR